jgi:hypothetical protein
MAAPEPPAVPKIDPAEALVVVAGLDPFLRHTSRDLGSKIVQAEALPETLEGKIYRFINRTDRQDASDLPPFDFDEVVALLDNPDEDGIDKTLAAFGGQHELALQVGSQVTRIHGYVRAQIPRRTHIGIDGAEVLPPAKSELFRFRRCWRVASDPLSIFDQLQEFALSRDQVKCFAEMFPTTFATFWPTIQQQLVRKKTVSQHWRLPRQKDTLLRVLGQQEGQSILLANALIPIYAQEQAAEAAANQRRAGKAGGGGTSESTAVQQLDAPT